MANYEIHIQDVENKEDDLILHYAERDAIELNWLGGDSKTQPIVGSELNFSLEASDARDAAFIELFTLDEKRWLVTMRISESQELVWQGYILPESYQEPYENSIFYVSVSAVDGLGLLRGVKLADDFYNDEKSVMQVLCAILKLTKIDLEIFFSPAIVNANEKDWNKLLVDTLLWDKSKDNAYQLLADLLESIRCQIFQCEGRWYIEGFNKRQLLKVSYDVYNVDGTYLRTQEVEKTIKQIPFLRSPEVRMVPGIKEAVVTYERNTLAFSEDIVQENDVPWVIYPGQINQFWYAKNWDFSNNSVPKILTLERNLIYLNPFDKSELEISRFITSKEKIYVEKNSTIKIILKIKVHNYDFIPEAFVTETIIKNWSKLQIYEVRLNKEVILTNQNATIQDQTFLEFNNGQAEVELIFRVEKNGFIDLKFYEPFGFTSRQYPGTQFKEISIEQVPEVKDEVYVVENTDLGSNISELDIRFGDDATLLTEAFYINKTRKIKTTSPSYFWFKIDYYNIENGITYAFVPIVAAVLAERLKFQKDKVRHVIGAGTNTGQIIDTPRVVFNYRDGESHSIVVQSELTDGYIRILNQTYKEETEPRNKIQEWSDAIAPIQNKRYGQVVAEIEKRIYETPHFSFEGSADAPIKYNDIVKFKYFGEQRFFTLSKCNWVPDGNTSSIIMNEMLYEGFNSEVLPPTVDAGEDIRIDEGATTSFLSAVASSPSGFIETILWEQIAGSSTVVIDEPNSLQTSVSNLTGDFYTFRITVTDSNGLTAFDEVNVIRKAFSSLLLTLIESIVGEKLDDENDKFSRKYYKWNVSVSPELIDGASVSVVFDAFLEIFATDPRVKVLSKIKITKNNVLIYDFQLDQINIQNGELNSEFNDMQFSMSKQDTLTIEIDADVEFFIEVTDDDFNNVFVQADSRSKIVLKSAEMSGDMRLIDNLPKTKEAFVEI